MTRKENAARAREHRRKLRVKAWAELERQWQKGPGVWPSFASWCADRYATPKRLKR